MTTRRLQVYLNRELVGELAEHNGWWQFQYHSGWLNAPAAHPLTPTLPLRPQAYTDSGNDRPVQAFFDNLLPEEQARALLAQHHRVALEDSFSLLQLIGAESAGAVTLLPPGEQLPAGDVVELTPADLSERIGKLPRAPLNSSARKRMSLAGAQHKMLVVRDPQGHLYEPVGDMPSSHILKPEHSQPEIYPFTVRNEFFVMRLAGECGLLVPKCDIAYLPEAIYLVERFDRRGIFPHQVRVHTLDGCQVLGIPAAAKYRANSLSTLQQLMQHCRSKALTAQRLYRWLVFNFLVGNGDAHLKNLSFTYSADGLELAPHYDLLSTVVYEEPHQHHFAPLSQALGDALCFTDVRRHHLLAAGAVLGLRASLAERELDRLLAMILPNALQLMEPLQVDGHAGELRLLRQIYQLALTEFSSQLR